VAPSYRLKGSRKPHTLHTFRFIADKPTYWCDVRESVLQSNPGTMYVCNCFLALAQSLIVFYAFSHLSDIEDEKNFQVPSFIKQVYIIHS
jgi:hypothetical protein